MPTTDRTTTLATNSQASRPQGRSRDERGLMTLEWLLIVGAIAGLAATSVLAVQRVLDNTAEVPVDPLVSVLEADIAAAFAAAAADNAALSDPYNDAAFESRCQAAPVAAFGDVVGTAVWTAPVTIPADPPDYPDARLDTGARCVVTPLAGLGG